MFVGLGGGPMFPMNADCLLHMNAKDSLLSVLELFPHLKGN